MVNVEYLDGPALHRWLTRAVAELVARRAEINKLNVFPVPDADTGSNMAHTMEAALAEVNSLPAAHQCDITKLTAAIAVGAVKGARGNSGMVLSQVLRGLAQSAVSDRITGRTVQQALTTANKFVHHAIIEPVEGTVVTVLRAAAIAANQAPTDSLIDVLTAATTAGALLPFAHAQTAVPAVKPALWQGVALGSGAELRLYHPNPAVAQSLIKRSLDEVARLEKVFSLYRDDSQIQQLNRTGSLKNPSPDLLAVLSQSRYVHRLTQGAFDPTVQTLWNAYARYFAKHPNSKTPPPHLAAALKHIGFGHVRFGSTEIRFTRPQMAITLNGIAQGYITDRITALLQHAGLTHALIDMGELRHLDIEHKYPEQISVRDPKNPKGILFQIPLDNQALATSGGYGTHFDNDGRFTHLFNPKTGGSSPRYQSISVRADQAALADALSTAFAVSSESVIRNAVKQRPDIKAWAIALDGTVKEYG